MHQTKNLYWLLVIYNLQLLININMYKIWTIIIASWQSLLQKDASCDNTSSNENENDCALRVIVMKEVDFQRRKVIFDSSCVSREKIERTSKGASSAASKKTTQYDETSGNYGYTVYLFCYNLFVTKIRIIYIYACRGKYVIVIHIIYQRLRNLHVPPTLMVLKIWCSVRFHLPIWLSVQKYIISKTVSCGVFYSSQHCQKNSGKLGNVNWNETRSNNYVVKHCNTITSMTHLGAHFGYADNTMW